MTTLLEVRDLSVAFPAPGGAVRPVDGISFDVAAGECLGLVGESGSGKSLTGLALLGLVPPPGALGAGSRIRLAGQELVGLPERALERVRGRRVAMVFQDPMASLDPLMTIEAQLVEVLRLHHRLDRATARARAVELLAECRLPDPRGAAQAWPHQLSGGMRQRAALALALAGNPELLVADEATTALDVTVQAEVLAMLDELRTRRGLGVLLVSHDLTLVAGHADRVAVMYAGRIVESGPAAVVLRSPAHPYTRALLQAVPRIEGARGRLAAIPGAVPDPSAWPGGCRFHPRCPARMDRCATEPPPATRHTHGHEAECWLGVP